LSPEYGVQKLVYHVTLSLFFLPNPDDLQGLFPLNGPVWSLFFEMVVNVFYALTLRYFISEKRLWMIIASCGIGLLICILIQGSADVGWKLKSLPAGFVRVGFSFYAGLLIACITLLLVVDPPKGAVGVSDALTIMLLFPICVMFAMQQYPSGMTAKIFKLGGLASYAIYVLHVPTARLFGDSFEILFKMELKPGLLAASIFSILFIGCCLLLDRFFDIPLRQRLRRYA
jgi:peptidoglycan/LPS O-acetylase OafA/YrhL